MQEQYIKVSYKISRLVTREYSTSFSIAVGFLGRGLREAIYSIYGFVRYADEIADSFHEYDKDKLLEKFEKDYYEAMNTGISLNPVLNSFHLTVKKYNIPDELIAAFLKSMRTDFYKSVYKDSKEINEYIYGSADAVGLMCLKVFSEGDENLYEDLKPYAMKLGSAFQKVNFLRDIKNDISNLRRWYFPGTEKEEFNDLIKDRIIEDIERDFKSSAEGIKNLPRDSGLGVTIAYEYYRHLLRKLKKTGASTLMTNRIRVSGAEKAILLVSAYIKYKLSNADRLYSKSIEGKVRRITGNGQDNRES